jgi:hypothetical protein
MGFRASAGLDTNAVEAPDRGWQEPDPERPSGWLGVKSAQASRCANNKLNKK